MQRLAVLAMEDGCPELALTKQREEPLNSIQAVGHMSRVR